MLVLNGVECQALRFSTSWRSARAVQRASVLHAGGQHADFLLTQIVACIPSLEDRHPHAGHPCAAGQGCCLGARSCLDSDSA